MAIVGLAQIVRTGFPWPIEPSCGGMKSESRRAPLQSRSRAPRLPIDSALCVRYLSTSSSPLQFRPRLGEARSFGAHSACKGRDRRSQLNRKHKREALQGAASQPRVLAPTREPVRIANSASPVHARLTNCLGVSSVGSCECSQHRSPRRHWDCRDRRSQEPCGLLGIAQESIYREFSVVICENGGHDAFERDVQELSKVPGMADAEFRSGRSARRCGRQTFLSRR